jgi:hypothetical protein
MTGPINALAAWSSSALRPVELPSGMKALVRLPNVMELVRTEKLPQELRELAFRYASDGIEVAKLDGDDLVKFVQFTYELIARSLRYLAPVDSPAWDRYRTEGIDPADEGWQAVQLDPGQISGMDVDQADLEALGQIAGRMKTPNEVTAMSRFDRGIIREVELAAAIDSGDGSRVGDFGPFRGEPGSDHGGDDGADLRAATVGSARDLGSSRRVRRRRGASA